MYLAYVKVLAREKVSSITVIGFATVKLRIVFMFVDPHLATEHWLERCVSLVTSMDFPAAELNTTPVFTAGLEDE